MVWPLKVNIYIPTLSHQHKPLFQRKPRNNLEALCSNRSLKSYLCLSRSWFSIVINDSFQDDAEMRQWISRDLPKMHFSHSAEAESSAMKNFRPKFQTGVSELCLSRNRFVLWSMTSSEMLKWGNGWTSHNNDMSVPCRSWKTVPAFKFRESKMSQIKAHGCTGRCSLSFCKKEKKMNKVTSCLWECAT